MKRLISYSILCTSFVTGFQSVQAQDARPGTSTSPGSQETAKPAVPVLLCGSGPAPHYENMTDGLITALSEAKLIVKTAEGATRASCLEKAIGVGATTLLYAVATVSERNASETSLSVQCFSSDGTKLWEEDQSGPLMSSSVRSTVRIVTEKMVKKLKTHIGKKGLLPTN